MTKENPNLCQQLLDCGVSSRTTKPTLAPCSTLVCLPPPVLFPSHFTKPNTNLKTNRRQHSRLLPNLLPPHHSKRLQILRHRNPTALRSPLRRRLRLQHSDLLHIHPLPPRPRLRAPPPVSRLRRHRHSLKRAQKRAPGIRSHIPHNNGFVWRPAGGVVLVCYES